MGGLLKELDEAGKMEVDDDGGEHHNGERSICICGDLIFIFKKRLGAHVVEAVCGYAGEAFDGTYGRGTKK